MIEAAGFEILQRPDPNDRSNLLFVARKRDFTVQELAADADEVAHARSQIGRYVATRACNLEALTSVAAELSGLAPRGVALWGAGRLFDALVLHGGFNPKKLRLLIDVHLKQHVPERHGVAVSGPEALAGADPSFIVVMSRAFAGEIAAVASEAAPKAEMLLYSDLLARARVKLAA
jgi:hypothetical protein